MSDTLHIIDARYVQMEDIEETANWCGGDIGVVYEGDSEGQHYIQIDDFHRAVTGGWIVQTNDGSFASMTDDQYYKTFYAASKHRDKFAATLRVVQAAMADGSAALLKNGDLSMIAEAATLRIMELLEQK